MNKTEYKFFLLFRFELFTLLMQIMYKWILKKNLNIEHSKWILNEISEYQIFWYLLILFNIHLLCSIFSFFSIFTYTWFALVKWITQNEIAKKFDIQFCSVFSYFQYSLTHDSALSMILIMIREDGRNLVPVNFGFILSFSFW